MVSAPEEWKSTPTVDEYKVPVRYNKDRNPRGSAAATIITWYYVGPQPQTRNSGITYPTELPCTHPKRSYHCALNDTPMTSKANVWWISLNLEVSSSVIIIYHRYDPYRVSVSDRKKILVPNYVALIHWKLMVERNLILLVLWSNVLWKSDILVKHTELPSSSFFSKPAYGVVCVGLDLVSVAPLGMKNDHGRNIWWFS